MLQLGGDLDLALEAVDADAGGKFRREHLDDDLAAERRLVGDEHARHPAAPQLALERVGAAQRLLKTFAKV